MSRSESERTLINDLPPCNKAFQIYSSESDYRLRGEFYHDIPLDFTDFDRLKPSINASKFKTEKAASSSNIRKNVSVFSKGRRQFRGNKQRYCERV